MTLSKNVIRAQIEEISHIHKLVTQKHMAALAIVIIRHLSFTGIRDSSFICSG